MIELYEGVPGSGKSYYAVAEKLLPAVRKGRRIYLYVDGIYLDRLALFTGIPLADLQQQITVWGDPMDVLAMHRSVEPQSLVMIDEAQTVFRALERVDKSLLRWLETHRHYGVDVLVCCQDYKQMSCGVTRLVEATVKFRKLALVGLQRHSQAKVRGNPEDQEIIRTFTFKYSPEVYAYYSSYAAAAIREEKRAHTVWKSAKVAAGLVAGLFAVALVLWKPWTSLETTANAHAPTVATSKPKPLPGNPAPLPLSPPPVVESPGEPEPAAPGIRIQGVLVVEEGSAEERMPRYLLEDGSILTASQITGRYGIFVKEFRDGPLARLVGEGIHYESNGH
ncbi:MAG: hypothetical protein EPO61_12605 [Nitrospirae bacterium]|nr:MAG: hypothetical protein EPO61_12605 [Nitrospirota bacterium]